MIRILALPPLQSQASRREYLMHLALLRTNCLGLTHMILRICAEQTAFNRSSRQDGLLKVLENPSESFPAITLPLSWHKEEVSILSELDCVRVDVHITIPYWMDSETPHHLTVKCLILLTASEDSPVAHSAGVCAFGAGLSPGSPRWVQFCCNPSIRQAGNHL